MPDLVDDLIIHPRLVSAARSALQSGAPILCDATMVATGITAGRLPAAIVGCPVGFIGAAESKDALASLARDHGIDIPFVTVRGRRGGSAITSSAINALASEAE